MTTSERWLLNAYCNNVANSIIIRILEATNCYELQICYGEDHKSMQMKSRDKMLDKNPSSYVQVVRLTRCQ